MTDISFNGIRAFVFDVDGILTNGGIFADNEGNLFRTFDAKDAFGMRMASMQGYKLGVITGGRSISIVKRMKVCGVEQEDVYLGSRDKIKDFNDFCRRHSLAPEEVMYFGDDLPDIPVIRACGVGVWPCTVAGSSQIIRRVIYDGTEYSFIRNTLPSEKPVQMVRKKAQAYTAETFSFKKLYRERASRQRPYSLPVELSCTAPSGSACRGDFSRVYGNIETVSIRPQRVKGARGYA